MWRSSKHFSLLTSKKRGTHEHVGMFVGLLICKKIQDETLRLGVAKFGEKGIAFMEERLQVGIVSSTHGVRGEVKVFPTTDDVKRFKKLKEVILDTGKEQVALEIEGVKFFKQFAILKFKGIDTMDDVMKYKGKSLFVTRENAVKLKKDEYFIADLIGLKVIDEEEKEIGTLRNVMETGANDVYVIDCLDGRELLLPAIKQCVLLVDLEAGLIKVHVLEGLLDA